MATTIGRRADATVGGGAARHVPALDGLRGLAIALVLVCHVSSWGGLASTWFDVRLQRVLNHGALGVDLFFVLSGYLITGILLDTRGRRGYASRFYIRRALRIVPLYVVTLLVAMVLVPLLLPVSDAYRAVAREQVWFWTYLTNVRVVTIEAWEPLLPFGHFWSLAVEEQFYLVWPAVVALVPRRWLARACLVLLAVAAVTHWVLVDRGQDLAAYVLLPANAAGLAVGAHLAARHRTGRLPSRRAAVAAVVGLPPILAWLAWWSDSRDPTAAAGTHLVAALWFGALVVLAVGEGAPSWFRRPATSRPLRWLGRYSYGLYVVHLPVLHVIVHALDLPARRFPPLLGTDLPGIVAVGVLMVVGSVALALVSWRVVERPLLSLKDRLAPTP